MKHIRRILDSMTATCTESLHLLEVYGHRALTVERGDGCWLYGNGGRRYLDFITGIGVNALGYGHPALLEALRAQAGLCLHTSNLHSHPYQGELAAKLAAWSGLDRVFFSNSGTEAMEAALKAVRARANRQGRRRHRIIALENGFHGRTAGALSITSQAKYREPFLPLLPETVFVPANDVTALTAAAGEDLIAIVTETIQGEGGVHVLRPEFLTVIAGLAAAHDAVWIADETQCGLGRTGERFAFQSHPEGLRPGIVVTAKPLGGGLPLGATIFDSDAATAIGEGLHGTTFGGGPLACRLGSVFLDQVDALLPAIRRNGADLHGQLHRLAAANPIIKQIRGRGLMAGIELTVPGAAYVASALDAGLVINCTHGNVLRLLPPYIAGTTEIDAACDILRRILRS